MIDLVVAASTPLERVIEHAEAASNALWAGGSLAVVAGLIFGMVDSFDRAEVRGAIKKSADAIGDSSPTAQPWRGAAAVELVRALHGPTQVIFGHSRAMLALATSAILFISGGLVALFETALVANHCKGTVVGGAVAGTADPASSAENDAGGTAPVDEPSPSNTATSVATEDPRREAGSTGDRGNRNSGEGDGGNRSRDGGGARQNRDGEGPRRVNRARPDESDANDPTVFYPPGCSSTSKGDSQKTDAVART